MQFYGINNNADPKRERMIVDEVNANNEALFVGPFGDMLEQRKRFVDEAKEKFSEHLSEGFDIEANRNPAKAESALSEEEYPEETFSSDVEVVEQEGGGDD